MSELYKAVMDAKCQVTQLGDGVVLCMNQSLARPESCNVVIFAPREEQVQEVLQRLTPIVYSQFLPPVRCADGVFASMGRIRA